MKIICTSQDESHRVTFSLNIWLHLVIPALFVALLMGVFVTVQMKSDTLKKSTTSLVQTQPQTQQNLPLSSDDTREVELETLARRLGMLEAESLRLNAFGARIVKMARLDPEEFAFDENPSLGGAREVDESGETESGYGVTQEALLKSIDALEKLLMDQRNRLEGVLQVINGRILDKEVMPDGMPVEKGYISSRFGFRRDPFTGKKRMHKGIDFAARKGTPVSCVAGGVVEFAGNKGGYGNVIQIDHGEGISTRYGHLSVIEAKVGQVVKKGDIIAQVGSTGRSTGPHLHLEVLKNGVQQNPAKYLAHLSGKK